MSVIVVSIIVVSDIVVSSVSPSVRSVLQAATDKETAMAKKPYLNTFFIVVFFKFGRYLLIPGMLIGNPVRSNKNKYIFPYHWVTISNIKY